MTFYLRYRNTIVVLKQNVIIIIKVLISLKYRKIYISTCMHVIKYVKNNKKKNILTKCSKYEL